MIKLPEKFEDRMKKLLGDSFEDYRKALEMPAIRGLRVNTEKISVEKFLEICTFEYEKIPYVPNGFYFDYEKIGNHPFHHAGMIYIQEPGAMAPAECIDLDPNWTVLDMCASPGGKSTQLRNKLSRGSVLVSNEIVPSRCKTLTGNIERLGFQNTVTTCMDSKRIAKTFSNIFDLVMVDAPCSGEGMFRKDENAIFEWSEENIKMCASRQLDILDNACIALKNGGYIIYATCTFSLEENEMVIDAFLKKHPEFELVEVKDEVKNHTVCGIQFDGCQCENMHFCRRFYPHNSRGEGQFMAVLHNTGVGTFTAKTPQTTKEKVDKVVFDFLDDVLIKYEKDYVTLYNGNPVYFTPDFHIQKGTAFSCGVTIGEIRKNYILPHHQFFMALGKDFKRKIELRPDSEEIMKYLHGEEFSTDCESGWAVVTVNGCSVGGVKVVSGRAKNHYPKGLRTKTMHSN